MDRLTVMKISKYAIGIPTNTFLSLQITTHDLYLIIVRVNNINKNSGLLHIAVETLEFLQYLLQKKSVITIN